MLSVQFNHTTTPPSNNIYLFLRARKLLSTSTAEELQLDHLTQHRAIELIEVLSHNLEQLRLDGF